jgi:hypothetical protein
MERRTGILAGLLALPVALLATLPAGGWQLTSALQGWHVVTAGTAHHAQLHRGTKVRITGEVQGPLRPGTWAPVALSLHNPNSRAIQMQRIRVTIAAVVAPHADAAHPCTKADFSVRQMSRRTLALPAGRATDLAALGVASQSGPWLTMLNRPVNQDGCKGARLKLRFKARGLHR